MPLKIEDYALIGDAHTAALVGRDGSIDWLCLPSFGSDACFAALLGKPEHGRWLLAPHGGGVASARRYRGDTLVLETDFRTPEGDATVIDFMPHRSAHDASANGPERADLVRIVRCTRGRVALRSELVVRYGYGDRTPWVHPDRDAMVALAGPDGLSLRADQGIRIEDEPGAITASFELSAGESARFVLTWFPSHELVPPPIDADAALEDTAARWTRWAARCTHPPELRADVMRSLITLKALTYHPTGGMVAAPTTSLPEWIGGVRNWDYRFCWLRDATFTLMALMGAGFTAEAQAFRDWLLRAVGGHPSEVQVMYGPSGERRLTEIELGWLPGYEGSRPVRIGNAAVDQLQLDVYGEVVDCLWQARRAGLERSAATDTLEVGLLDFLETRWQGEDEGIWEVRGPPRHFVHSKVMAWVAFDRAVKAIEQEGLEGPVERFRATRDAIHREVCAHGFDAKQGAFTQSFGSPALDASLLLIPHVGFLPATDSRVRGTIDAVARELSVDGFVRRYQTKRGLDGLPEGEGVFLACTLWLADAYAMLGRVDDADALFRRVAALRNDVGLLSEQYDPAAKRFLGNFPQAFSHVALVNTAVNLSIARGAARPSCAPPSDRGGNRG